MIAFSSIGAAIEHVSGQMWRTDAPPLFRAENERRDGRTVLRLYEHDTRLGPASAGHADIESLGEGRYSLWQGGKGPPTLYFSTSDGADPATSERVHTAGDIAVSEETHVLVDARSGDGLRFAARALERQATLRVLTDDGDAWGTCEIVANTWQTYAVDGTGSFESIGDADVECARSGDPGTRTPAAFEVTEGAVVIESPEVVLAAVPLGYLALWAVSLAIIIRAAAPVTNRRTWALALVGVVAFNYAATRQVEKIRGLNDGFRQNYATHFRVGEWLRENARPGDLLVSENQHIVQYAARGVETGYRDITKPIDGETPGAILASLRAEGVTLVVLDSNPVQPHERVGAKLARLAEAAETLPGLARVASLEVGRAWADVYRLAPHSRP